MLGLDTYALYRAPIMASIAPENRIGQPAPCRNHPLQINVRPRHVGTIRADFLQRQCSTSALAKLAIVVAISNYVETRRGFDLRFTEISTRC